MVLGAEGAGTVTAVGAGVTGCRWATGWPGRARRDATPTHAAIPASRIVPVPPEVDLQVAAAVMLQGMTAHYLCFSTYPVREGDVAVVHARPAASGCC